LRKILPQNSTAFNLYVYQAGSTIEKSLSTDESIWRYNVNGIELNGAGFKKLASEIDLKTMNCLIPEVQKDPMIIHTGKFPLVTGAFQRLIVREDWVHELNPVDMEIRGKVNRKYYEVTMQQALKQYVESHEKNSSVF
jgi:hypothetical protein